jgi:hypothetical protein
MDNWDYIKLKDFYKAKKIINRMQRQTMEWEKNLQTMYLIKCSFYIQETTTIQWQ